MRAPADTTSCHSPRALLAVITALLAGCVTAPAQTNVTNSGDNRATQWGGAGNTDGLGNAARFAYPFGVAVDSAGNLFVADSENCMIRKVNPDGLVTTLAGSAGNRGCTDGPGSVARFSCPRGIAVDSAGNVYVADSGNSTIRKVSTAGLVTTVASRTGNKGIAYDRSSATWFQYPIGVAVDRAGNLYVADADKQTIRKVSAVGVVTTLAGRAARFNQPFGVAVDSAGNVYVADGGNSTILKVSAVGVLTTLAGSAGKSGSADGTGSAALFNGLCGVAVDNVGNAFVADSLNHTIRKVSPDGLVTTLAGTAGKRGCADGQGSAARFSEPFGVAVDSAGYVYVADKDNSTIRKISPAGVVTTLAGRPPE